VLHDDVWGTPGGGCDQQAVKALLSDDHFSATAR
jgi:hypothetical protein